MFQELGKLIIIFGITFVILGLIFTSVGKIPYLGRLPGDIYVKKENFTLFFPFTSCLIISLILSGLAAAVIKILKIFK